MPHISVKNSLSGKRRPHTLKIILFTKLITLTIIIMRFKPVIFVTALLLQASALNSEAQVSYSSKGFMIGPPITTDATNQISMNYVNGVNWKCGADGMKIDLTGSNPSISFYNGTTQSATINFFAPETMSYIPITCGSVLFRYDWGVIPSMTALETIKKIRIVEGSTSRSSGEAQAMPYKLSATDTETAFPEAVATDSYGKKTVDVVALVKLLFDSVVELENKIESQSDRINQLRSAEDKLTCKTQQL